MVLKATFVRHRERRDRIYVTRQDGTSTFWDFPSYGDQLPHDLVHLVVETELGLADGFWGMVDQGVEVTLIDNQATLVRQGRPLVGQPGFDFFDLTRAEEAVADLGATYLSGKAPPEISPSAVATIRQRLHDLGREWRGLTDGAAISLTFGTESDGRTLGA
ncbi:MAG TPA: hypothetical protein VIJ09_03440 [Acidimicrobiales bacterium]|jgi:hypothetical protein